MLLIRILRYLQYFPSEIQPQINRFCFNQTLFNVLGCLHPLELLFDEELSFSYLVLLGHSLLYLFVQEGNQVLRLLSDEVSVIFNGTLLFYFFYRVEVFH